LNSQRTFDEGNQMAATAIATTEPGIYSGMPFEQYLAIDAVSNTRLGQLAKSPRHYKMNAGLDEGAKHLVLGQLVHAGRLEILALAKRYAVMPDYHLHADNCTGDGKPSTSKGTRFVKERVADFEASNSDKKVVPLEWFNEMEAIVGSLVADETAYRMLSGRGESELTLVWRDYETGLLCKARMDFIRRDLLLFVDLKTTTDLSAFTRVIGRYGYHRQMAHYQTGWAVLNGGELLTPWIVAAEKCNPYCVMSAPLDDEAVYEGDRQRRRLMELLLSCRESNHWPGPESPTSWKLPEWAMSSGEPLELIVDDNVVEV
jgi:hypothetical protein